MSVLGTDHVKTEVKDDEGGAVVVSSRADKLRARLEKQVGEANMKEEPEVDSACGSQERPADGLPFLGVACEAC